MGLSRGDVGEGATSSQHLILNLEQSQYLINICWVNFREGELSYEKTCSSLGVSYSLKVARAEIKALLLQLGMTHKYKQQPWQQKIISQIKER